jgi:CRISPR-associated endonuclease Csy4
MDHYIDIRILPDAEMRENVLLNLLYTKFHKVLCDLKSTRIGVSFPEKELKLGRLMRIHGDGAELIKLQRTEWVDKLAGGYCEVSEISFVPKNVQYRTISRWQSNMSASHYRRLLKRGSISEEDARQYKAKMMHAQMTELPYVEMVSSSNGQRHRRYFQFGELQDLAVEDDFDQFGLSKTATIPWF